ncbi:MAG: ATPase [Deltaproteobacteria bacterium HGW-Deltaproteobacteria-10]|nr:MAG: ATPase [Deltaproteobacteria bacterium HGW-Deltaproteobacteria-10]
MKKIFKAANLSLLFLVLFLLPASIVFASGGGEGGHDGKKWVDFFWKTFDFVILVGFLYWMLAAKIKEFFVGRRQDIKDSLEKAARQKNEAEAKFREYSEKIDKASAEIDGIFEMIKAQGVEEKQKIIADAEKVARKIKEDSQLRTEQELKKASDQLRAEAVKLSIQMAEDILRRNITVQDHETLVREYMEKAVNKN